MYMCTTGQGGMSQKMQAVPHLATSPLPTHPPVGEVDECHARVARHGHVRVPQQHHQRHYPALPVAHPRPVLQLLREARPAAAAVAVAAIPAAMAAVTHHALAAPSPVAALCVLPVAP